MGDVTVHVGGVAMRRAVLSSVIVTAAPLAAPFAMLPLGLLLSVLCAVIFPAVLLLLFLCVLSAMLLLLVPLWLLVRLCSGIIIGFNARLVMRPRLLAGFLTPRGRSLGRAVAAVACHLCAVPARSLLVILGPPIRHATATPWQAPERPLARQAGAPIRPALMVCRVRACGPLIGARSLRMAPTGR